MAKIFKRLIQPTTLAGIASIMTAFGVTVSPELASAIGAVGASVTGLFLVWFDEDKNK